MGELKDLRFLDLSKEMERLSKVLTEIDQGFAQYLAQVKKDETDRQRALELGLVSRKVVDLSYRKDRVENKNLNRIRKFLALWNKWNRPTKTSTCFTDPVKGNISLENGVIQEIGIMDRG